MDVYHVLNRGVEKIDVVKSDDDRMRFVRSLYIMNDVNPPPNYKSQPKQYNDLHRSRQPLVYIHAWCLMNNHYHLLLSPVDEDLTKLSLFMKKLNMGYARFFNEKYDRSGYLWQGKYKKILVNNDSHFQYIPYYIHLNQLDYKMKQWRDGKANNVKEAFEILRDVRWSSYQDYNNIKNFPSVIHQSLMNEILGESKKQTENIRKIISDPALSSSANNFET